MHCGLCLWRGRLRRLDASIKKEEKESKRREGEEGETKKKRKEENMSTCAVVVFVTRSAVVATRGNQRDAPCRDLGELGVGALHV